MHTVLCRGLVVFLSRWRESYLMGEPVYEHTVNQSEFNTMHIHWSPCNTFCRWNKVIQTYQHRIRHKSSKPWSSTISCCHFSACGESRPQTAERLNDYSKNHIKWHWHQACVRHTASCVPHKHTSNQTTIEHSTTQSPLPVLFNLCRWLFKSVCQLCKCLCNWTYQLFVHII